LGTRAGARGGDLSTEPAGAGEGGGGLSTEPQPGTVDSPPIPG